MSWWDDEAPLRRWLTREQGYAQALRVLAENLGVVNKLFPDQFRAWSGLLSKRASFFAKTFEARCIARAHVAGIHVTSLEPDYGSGTRPDFEVTLGGHTVTVECTSLRYCAASQKHAEQALEDYEAFTWQLRAIRRPYLLTFNALPNLGVPGVVDTLTGFISEWFTAHQDGDREVYCQLPPFPGLERYSNGQPVLKFCFFPDLPHVAVSGVSPMGVPTGSPNTLTNALHRKAGQVSRSGRTNIIAVDIGFRVDLVLGDVPYVLTNQGLPALTKFWSDPRHEHVHGVVLLQDSIFANRAVQWNGFPRPRLTQAEESAVRQVAKVLSGS